MKRVGYVSGLVFESHRRLVFSIQNLPSALLDQHRLVPL